MNNASYVLMAAILIGSLTLIGCDTNEVESNEIVDIAMEPESATINAGETENFSLVGLTDSGERVEITDHEVRWWSTDTTVFEVDDNGNVIGRDAGTAYCMAEVTPLSKASAARFVGRDSASVTVLF